MSSETFNNSLQSGLHRELSQWAGHWSGTTKTWFEPGVLADESPIEGQMQPVLGGRFLMWTYQGQLQGKAHEGLAIFGCDLAHGIMQSAWIDSFHMGTGILFSEGNKQQAFSVTGKYRVHEGPEWGWRTTLEPGEDDTLLITAYNITPEGQEAKATESVLRRVKP